MDWFIIFGHFRTKIGLSCTENSPKPAIFPKPAETSHLLMEYFSKKFGFWVIETLCIAFFTIEFILRFWSCPDRFAFMRNFMNLIDLAAIIPYYIDMGVKLYLPDGPCPDSRLGF